jgi:hypothetical protein
MDKNHSHLPKLGALLNLQIIHRDVRGPGIHGAPQALLPHLLGLVGQRGDEVHAPVLQPLARRDDPDGLVHLLHTVRAAARAEQVVLERLHAERHAVDADAHELPEPGGVEGPRVHLDGHLRARRQAEPAPQRVEDGRDEARRDERRRAAPEEDGLERDAVVGDRARGGDLAEEEAHVVDDPGVVCALATGRGGARGGAERDDGEVAVVAALAAEGEVDVYGGWRELRKRGRGRWRGGGGGGGGGVSSSRWRAWADWGRFLRWEVGDEREGQSKHY